jgi:hypothetical protein
MVLAVEGPQHDIEAGVSTSNSDGNGGTAKVSSGESKKKKKSKNKESHGEIEVLGPSDVLDAVVSATSRVTKVEDEKGD